MSLDVSLIARDLDGNEIEVFDQNITHNLGGMAGKAGIYVACWRPEEKGWKYARDIIEPLEKGLADMRKRPKYYEKFNPDNGWGSYESFVPWIQAYLDACRKYPSAEIEVDR